MSQHQNRVPGGEQMYNNFGGYGQPPPQYPGPYPGEGFGVGRPMGPYNPVGVVGAGRPNPNGQHNYPPHNPPYPPAGYGGPPFQPHHPMGPHHAGYSSFQNSQMQSSIARSFFIRADRNRSGSLDPKEFHSVLDDLGMNMDYQECLQLFGTVDRNHSGSISEREFIEFFVNFVSRNIPGQNMPHPPHGNMFPHRPHGLQSFYTEERNRRNIARAMFYDADRDRNGMLDHNEFINILMRLNMCASPNQAMALFNQADRARNGYITIQEFENFYVNFCNQHQMTYFNHGLMH